METLTQEIPEHEIIGLMKTLKETGIKGVMKYSTVIVINHLQERGILPQNREQLVKSLKQNTEMTYTEVMSTVIELERWKKYLPTYTLELNQKLDRINIEMNTIVPFKYIGNRLVGITQNPNKRNEYQIYDGMGKTLILLGTINTDEWNINWNPKQVISQEVNKYTVNVVIEKREEIWK